MKNKVKRALENCELSIGPWLQIGAYPAIAEILAEAGFDWLAADCEHSDIDVDGFTRIENNSIKGAMWQSMQLENCSDVLLRDNRIDLMPGGSRTAVFLRNFNNVTAEGNVLNDSDKRPLYIFSEPAEKSKLLEKNE